jgi:hypothetical protein
LNDLKGYRSFADAAPVNEAKKLSIPFRVDGEITKIVLSPADTDYVEESKG